MITDFRKVDVVFVRGKHLVVGSKVVGLPKQQHCIVPNTKVSELVDQQGCDNDRGWTVLCRLHHGHVGGGGRAASAVRYGTWGFEGLRLLVVGCCLKGWQGWEGWGCWLLAAFWRVEGLRRLRLLAVGCCLQGWRFEQVEIVGCRLLSEGLNGWWQLAAGSWLLSEELRGLCCWLLATFWRVEGLLAPGS